MINYYTNKCINLDCTLSSRLENYYLVLRVITNDQLFLEQSVKRLVNTIISLFKTFD